MCLCLWFRSNYLQTWSSLQRSWMNITTSSVNWHRQRFVMAAIPLGDCRKRGHDLFRCHTWQGFVRMAAEVYITQVSLAFRELWEVYLINFSGCVNSRKSCEESTWTIWGANAFRNGSQARSIIRSEIFATQCHWVTTVSISFQSHNCVIKRTHFVSDPFFAW